MPKSSLFVARRGKRGSGFGGLKSKKKNNNIGEKGRFKNVGGGRSRKAEAFAASQSSVESLQDGLSGNEENESRVANERLWRRKKVPSFLLCHAAEHMHMMLFGNA